MQNEEILEQNMDLVLYFIRCAIMGEGIQSHQYDEMIQNVNWQELYKTAQENQLIALLYPIVEYCNEQIVHIDDALFAGWKSVTRGSMLYELSKYQQIHTIVKEAEQEKITLVFFKGMILADLYPQYCERPGCDSDIFVEEKDKEKAENMFRRLGYCKDEDHSKQQVQVYEHPSGHVIELHTRLWEDYEGPRIELLKSMQLTAPESLIKVHACGMEVTTLGYEQHLIYQLFHIIKHFSLNGVGARYLVDITLYVNQYGALINKESFWEKIEQLGYTKFVQYFFYICSHYLGMDTRIMPEEQVTVGRNIQGFKKDLFTVGEIYDKDAGWQIMGAMEAYFTGSRKVSASRFRRKVDMMFPGVEAMPRVYGYVHRYPVLLPVGWIHRGGKYLVKWLTHRDSFYNAPEKLDVAEHRLYMLKSLGLSDEVNATSSVER